jgi:cytoskeletal protein CcmA (bactofilin family)
MFGKKNNKPMSRIDSLIGTGTRVEGNVLFSGGLRVDGEVIGNIGVEKGQVGTLVVSEKARVEGEVRVSHLIVNGTIDGPVAVSESLELQPSARVTGEVSYAALEMQQGAVVQGRLVHQATGVTKTVELKLAAGQER